MRPIVPPPYEVQQRAWECAFMLKDFYADMPINQRVQVEVVYRTHPDGLGWVDIARMLVIYREVCGVRV